MGMSSAIAYLETDIDTIDPSLPECYKRTEIGMIPVDWNCCSLDNIVIRVGSGITPTGGERIYVEDGRPFIRSQNVGWGKLLLDDLVYITDKIHATFPTSEIKEGDILLNITGASIGRCAIADDRLSRGNVNQHVCEIRTDHSKLVPKYLNLYLLSSSGQKQIESFQAGGNRQGLNYGQIRSFLIPVPSSTEQQAIAETLSDVDALIESLEKLIAKKRDIKLATMQQLLTGKTRLTGFTGDWIELNMEHNSILKARIGWQGLTTAEYLTVGDYYLVTGTEFVDGRIAWTDCHFVDRSRYLQDTNIQLAVGDVLLTKDGTIGKAGYVDYIPKPATLNSGIFVIRPRRNAYHPQYMYYVLTSRIFSEFLTKLQAGSTINHLYQKDFVGFTFFAPLIDEQVAITTVLSDMDAEITNLEQRLEKTKQIKQGMMQQLLTGKVRLVSPQKTEATV